MMFYATQVVHSVQISGIVFAPPSLYAHIAQTRKLQIEELLRTKVEGSRNESAGILRATIRGRRRRSARGDSRDAGGGRSAYADTDKILKLIAKIWVDLNGIDFRRVGFFLARMRWMMHGPLTARMPHAPVGIAQVRHSIVRAHINLSAFTPTRVCGKEGGDWAGKEFEGDSTL